MTRPGVEHLSVVGVGLIGGSVGLAARVRRAAGRVVGVGRAADTLRRAQALGVIDTFSTDLAAGVAHADLVVVCTPVDRVADDVLACLKAMKPGAIVTDAGSTKARILETVSPHVFAHGAKFVGGHPLAGSEKKGPDHARADLFDGRVVVLTPDDRSDLAAVLKVERFWQALGATVRRMAPEDHDRALAATSHLPHAVAAALAAATPADWLGLTAGGFRDTTRVAGGDPELWAAIFEANRDAVLHSLAAFGDQVERFRAALAAGDRAAVALWLAEGKRVRDALGS